MPIPRFRDDITIQVLEQDGQKYVCFTDPKGLAEYPVAIPFELMPLLQLFDGNMTVRQLGELIKNETGLDADLTMITTLVEHLDNMGFMESEKFIQLKQYIEEYQNSPIRQPICAGTSYSHKTANLEGEMDMILEFSEDTDIEKKAKAIIVPHIDFLVGDIAFETYSAAYKALRGSDADVFIILGTAHKRSSDYFMFTEKNYETPLGIAETDNELLRFIKENVPFDIMIDDLAHLNEHSVELQIVLLQRMFRNRKFKVLPVLAGSMHEFIMNGNQPVEDDRFLKYLEGIRTAIKKSGKKAAFISSVDFSHIGRRFENNFDAEPTLPYLRIEDMELIEKLIHCNNREFFEHIAKVKNIRSVCGVSSIYSMLELVKPKRGAFLKYHQWNDKPTESAVTFASIAYYD
ncbi:MAG: AmmeMemoRadiSam system protein [Bacteroidota bacterium]|nr:AmmeMemoRadiSam system protein [Bacteroidota bacterium]